MLDGGLVPLVPPAATASDPRHARGAGAPEDDGLDGDDETMTCFAIVVDGAVRGTVQYGEEDDPDYRHASIRTARAGTTVCSWTCCRPS